MCRVNISKIIKLLRIAYETNNLVCLNCQHLCYNTEEGSCYCGKHKVLLPDQAFEWYCCLTYFFGGD